MSSGDERSLPEPRSDARPRLAGLALSWSDGAALLAVLLWGLNFPVTKSLMNVADPSAVTFLRAACSTLVFLAVLGIKGQWTLPARRDVGPFLLVGLLGSGLSSALYSYGLHLTSASHSGLIYTLTPLLVFGLSHMLGYLRLTRRDLFGLGLGLAGAILIVGLPAITGAEHGGSTVVGDLLTVGGALGWGLWTLRAAPLLRRYGTLATTTWITGLGGLVFLPLAVPALLALDWSRVTPLVVGGFLYSGTLAGACGGLLWYGAVRRIGAARTMVYANLESFFAVVFAALLLGERVEWTAILGGAAIVAGVVLTRRSRPSQVAKTAATAARAEAAGDAEIGQPA